MNVQMKHLLELAAKLKAQQAAAANSTSTSADAVPANAQAATGEAAGRSQHAIPNAVAGATATTPAVTAATTANTASTNTGSALTAPAAAPRIAIPAHLLAARPAAPSAATAPTAQVPAKPQADAQCDAPAASTASTAPAAPISAATDLRAALAKLAAKSAPAKPAPVVVAATTSAPAPAGAIAYNAQQLEAIALAGEGRGFCLVGAAGTGKTTTVMQIVRSAIAAVGANAIANVAFTRRAVRNIRKACARIPEAHIAQQAAQRCSTIHGLLKFRPVEYEYVNSKGAVASTRRFEPTYRVEAPLEQLRLVIVDEASMLDLALWKQLLEACPHAVFIFIGDLNQLKPVFGLPVLGFKLEELPVVELTQVYRQAMESPIVRFQYDYTLRGRLPTDRQLAEMSTDAAAPGLEFVPLTKLREPAEQCRVFATYLKREYEAGRYQPVKHAVLLPNRKLRGTSGAELFSTEGTNRWVAQWIGEQRGAIVHHIRAGVRELFLAVGDYVVFGAEDYFVQNISPNRKYSGRRCMEPSHELTRLGWYMGKGAVQGADEDADEFEALLAMHVDEGDSQACSHMVTLVPAAGESTLEDALAYSEGEQLSLTSIGDFNEQKFNLGYCISVHQSQGSEWEKVYIAITNHAKNMRTRELLYTGMTRAAKELTVVYSPGTPQAPLANSIAKCIENQSMPGVGWRNKVKYFTERREEYAAFMATPTVYGPECFKDAMKFDGE